MYKLKHISRLGNEITYHIDYETFFKTYDITIYHDMDLNIWDGTSYDGIACRDIDTDTAVLIINDLILQTYEGMIKNV